LRYLYSTTGGTLFLSVSPKKNQKPSSFGTISFLLLGFPFKEYNKSGEHFPIFTKNVWKRGEFPQNSTKRSILSLISSESG